MGIGCHGDRICGAGRSAAAVASGFTHQSAAFHAPNADADILDRGAILARVGHDTQLLKDIVTVFLDECPKLLDDVRAAVRSGDAPKLRVAAHTLKGAVSNFSTWPSFEAALRLER